MSSKKKTDLQTEINTQAKGKQRRQVGAHLLSFFRRITRITRVSSTGRTAQPPASNLWRDRRELRESCRCGSTHTCQTLGRLRAAGASCSGWFSA